MTLEFDKTKDLIDLVLATKAELARKALENRLSSMGRTTPEFYDGVLSHGPKMSHYTSDQWLDFFRKIPHWRLLDDKTLMDKLSPNQREILFREPTF